MKLKFDEATLIQFVHIIPSFSSTRQSHSVADPDGHIVLLKIAWFYTSCPTTGLTLDIIIK